MAAPGGILRQLLFVNSEKNQRKLLLLLFLELLQHVFNELNIFGFFCFSSFGTGFALTPKLGRKFQKCGPGPPDSFPESFIHEEDELELDCNLMSGVL